MDLFVYDPLAKNQCLGGSRLDLDHRRVGALFETISRVRDTANQQNPWNLTVKR